MYHVTGTHPPEQTVHIVLDDGTRSRNEITQTANPVHPFDFHGNTHRMETRSLLCRN